MTNFLQDAADWLSDQLMNWLSVTVNYYRGTDHEDDISAVVVLHQYEVLDTEGVMISVKSRDYIFDLADLEINGVAITPRAGDRVIETVGGTSQTYEVMPLGAEPEYEPVDSDNLMVRVHTKRIA